MVVSVITTVDLSGEFALAGSGATWVLPWNTAIASTGAGIVESQFLTGNRVVVDGHIVSVGTGVISHSNDADLRVGKTGLIEAEVGLHCDSNSGDATYVNAGRIVAEIGIAVEAGRNIIRNTGVIECNFGIYTYLSGVYRESLDILNSGSISGVVGISAMGRETKIIFTDTSRLVGSYMGVEVRGGSGWTSTLENAGVIRAPIALEAGGGEDTFVNSGYVAGALRFGDGADTFRSIGGHIRGDISGQGGNDRYFIDDSSSRVIELVGQGTDSVFSGVSYALVSDGIELLKLKGRRNIDATGAGGDETITGNAGNNILSGLAGADRLSGGRGKDVIEGGDGADTFVFSTGFGKDRIIDFTDGDDTVDLSGLEAVNNFRDLTHNHMFETSAGVVIKDGDDQLLLVGITVADLQPSNFLFG